MNILVVDGNNIMSRAWHASRRNRVDLSSNGVDTGPLVLFVGIITRFVRQLQPSGMIVCWDGGRSNFRTALYPDYKVNRVTSHVTMEDQYVMAKGFLFLSGIRQVGFIGVEADDIIADICRNRDAFGNGLNEMVILSGDKDFLQLLEKGVTQIRPGSNDDLWTADRVISDLGCTPAQLPSVMALSGDTVDGVPGARGVGRKTACTMLQRHGWDLDEVLVHEPRLAGQESIVGTSLRLVDLRTDQGVVVGREIPGDLTFDPPSQAGDPERWQKMLDWLTEYELASIASRMQDGSLWRSRPKLGHPLAFGVRPH